MRYARLAILAAVIAVSGALLAACPKPNGYQAVRVFPSISFDQMTGAFPVPGAGNFALVLTKPGVIYRADLDDPNAAPTRFMDITSKIIQNAGIEEGLLGLAFPPDYPASRMFYVYYVAGNPRRAVVSRFIASGATADPATERVIMQIAQPYSNHKGGSMAFGPDGDLYIGVGDGGSEGDPQGNGQNVNTLLGKILRIDVSGADYTIPADNPFALGGGRPEIYAWGFRNPWRFSFDARTGQLWTGDVGQDAWEEVDRVQKGLNYGWNTVEGYACYHPASGCDTSGLTPPRAVYGHDAGCAVIGGYVYRGASMPELAGWYVYGDFCSGRVWAVSTGDTTSQPVQLMDSGLPIAAFMQGKDGDLYVVTFAGGIYKIVQK
ncbi:MAG: PQQ-dependent sugar dehydrogenase [Dehalococcoidia bacterium]